MKQAGMKKKKQPNSRCMCPFCETELTEEGSPFCQACKQLMSFCARCRIAVQKGVSVCPRCGEPLS